MNLSRPVLLAVALPFAALTAYALNEVGLIGIFTAHMNPGGAQVFTDLVIALCLLMVWMVGDARSRGITVWPYVVATLTLGSFGPLAAFDATGKLLTHAPSTYKIPVASDVPCDLRVALFDNANREDTIYRSKAVGEPPLMLGISVYCAILDALQGLAPHRPVALDAPATPERILMAAHALRAASAS